MENEKTIDKLYAELKTVEQKSAELWTLIRQEQDKEDDEWNRRIVGKYFLRTRSFGGGPADEKEYELMAVNSIDKNGYCNITTVERAYSEVKIVTGEMLHKNYIRRMDTLHEVSQRIFLIGMETVVRIILESAENGISKETSYIDDEMTKLWELINDNIVGEYKGDLYEKQNTL